MDHERFDRMTRSFATSRRRLIAAAAGVAAGLGLGASSALAGAPSPSRRSSVCRSFYATCTRGSQCCSGRCAAGRQYPRAIRNRCVCIPNCGGGRCGDDGCGGQCACDDGWVCSDSQICAAACADTTGFCMLTMAGAESFVPDGCLSYTRISDESCSTDEDCLLDSDYPNFEFRAPNLEAVCVVTIFYDGSPLVTEPTGRCWVKPLATGACWW